jgi:hypothetical protein
VACAVTHGGSCVVGVVDAHSIPHDDETSQWRQHVSRTNWRGGCPVATENHKNTQNWLSGLSAAPPCICYHPSKLLQSPPCQKVFATRFSSGSPSPCLLGPTPSRVLWHPAHVEQHPYGVSAANGVAVLPLVLSKCLRVAL